MSQKRADSLMAWMDYYLEVAAQGVRSEEVAGKIQLHLQRFQQFFEQRYGQERISSWVKRDVLAWQQSLEAQGLAPATINNHLASLSGFATWVHTQNEYVFSMGDPTKGVRSCNTRSPPPPPRARMTSLSSACSERVR